jgi:hypothetical protein
MENKTVKPETQPKEPTLSTGDSPLTIILSVLGLLLLIGGLGWMMWSSYNSEQESLKHTIVLEGCTIQKHDSSTTRSYSKYGGHSRTKYYVTSSCGVMLAPSATSQASLVIGETYTLEVTEKDLKIIAAVNNKETVSG